MKLNIRHVLQIVKQYLELVLQKLDENFRIFQMNDRMIFQMSDKMHPLAVFLVIYETGLA
jgi:hypothetical protein